MDYRKAEISDIKTLVTFRRQQLIDEGQVPAFSIDNELTQYFERCLTDGSLVQYFAVEDGTIVATGGMHLYAYPPCFKNPSDKMAYIVSIYTLPEYRGKGIATAIMHILIKEANLRGFGRIRLQASEGGRPVYEKLGFKDTLGFMTKE